jgi:ankyrin repeat protein
LQNTPADLFDAYATTLKRIEQQPGIRPQRALKVLTWAYLGQRPLKVVELQHALAVNPGDSTFNTEGIPSEKALIECCMGLVVIDPETSTIRLTHLTLQEHFDKHWKDLFPSGHSTIAATCLSYIQLDHTIPHPREEDTQHSYFGRLEAPPLLQYAIENVGRHLQMSSDQALAEQCIAILEQEKKLRLLELGMVHHHNTSLHWAAYFGCTSVAELLIGGNNPLHSNAEPPTQQMPPLHAIQQGTEQTANVILNQSAANINSMSSYNHTPLSLAAWEGHEEVVQLLLGVPGVNVNPKDRDGDTPLLCAALRGHEAVIRLLLNLPEVDVNSRSNNDCTPLLYTAREGYVAVVKLLLDTPGVDVNVTDMDGDASLSCAAWRGHEEVVRLLLDMPGLDIDARDKDGDTALSCAAQKGYETIVRLLLDVPRVDVNSRNDSGRSPLFYAAREGYEAVVRLLLDTPRVDVNASDGNGDAPLLCAAQNGHEAVVKLLLSTQAVDINHKNDQGETAFSLAKANGHETIGHLLPAGPG